MAVVKNRLKIFEPGEDSEDMANTKPQTALKPPPLFGQNVSPALQKLLNKQIEASNNEAPESVSRNAEPPVKTGPDTVAKEARNGVGSVVSAAKHESSASVSPVRKPIGARPPVGAVKPSEIRRTSQVNVPSVFKQDSVNTTTPPDSRRGSQVNVPEAFKVNSKNTGALSEVSSEDNKKPKTFAKPGATFPRPPPTPKPQLSGAETPVATNSVPSILNKTANISKPENDVHQSSNRFKLPAVDELQLKSPHSTSASSSVSSLSSPPPPPSEDKVTDFKSMLRSTKTTTQFAEKKAAIKPVLPPGTSSLNRAAGAEVKQTSDQNKLDSNGTTKGSTLPSSYKSGQNVPGLPSRLPGNQWKPVQNLKKLEDNEPIVERKTDSKKFKKIKLEACLPSSAAPDKPALPSNIDLTAIKQQYHKAQQTTDNAGSQEDLEDDVDQIYDDGVSLEEVVSRISSNKRQSERISIIPDMSAEEEGATYDDGITLVGKLPSSQPPPRAVQVSEEFYMDAETEKQMEEMEQLYEEDGALALSVEKLEEEKKRQQREEAEAKKKEEKEKKEKEKEEEKKRKKEQKEKAKKEKEELQLRKKFGLTGTETGVGEGTIKQDVKAWVPGGLSLKKGQIITIIRLDNNPANKWLIKSDNNMGYIDSSNIEVDPSIIRQAMANQAMGRSLSNEVDDDQPVYDDVPHDGQPNNQFDDGEIYEECP